MHESMNDDRELVAAMLAGDERAFTTFFETYFPRVYRFALPRMTRNADATKDVVQATLIKAMRAVGGWRGEAALFTWLCQICRRQIADHVRSERRHASKVVLIDDSEEVRAALESIAAPSTDNPLHGADSVELGGWYTQYSTGCHRPLWRRAGMEYVEGRSVEEISERLGIGQTAAQSLLARARVAFREGVEAVFARRQTTCPRASRHEKKP